MLKHAKRLAQWFVQIRAQTPVLERRGRLLGLLLAVCSAVLALNVLSNLAQAAMTRSDPWFLVFAAENLAMLLFLVWAAALNRAGRTTLAGYLFLGVIVAGQTTMYDKFAPDRLFFFYTVPIMAASFIVGPRGSFSVFGVSLAAFALIVLRDGIAVDYNTNIIAYSLSGLTVLAVVAWQAAASLEAALRDEHTTASKAQAILQSIGDGVVVFDAGWTAVVVNPSASLVFRSDPAHLLGQPVRDILRLVDAGGQIAPALVERVSQAALPEEYSAGISLTSGSRTLVISFAPVRLLHSADWQGVVMVVRDVSREVQAERTKAEFITLVSHELRTPMTSIRGYLDLMRKGTTGPLTDRQIGFVDRVLANANRLTALVEGLLDLLTVEASPTTQFQAVLLAEAVCAVTARMEPSFRAKPVQLEVDIDNDLWVTANPSHLDKVISHVLSNALRYTLKGSVRVTVRADGDRARVDVADTGIGIGEDDQPRIFERFFRAATAEANTIDGIGLGLSVAKSLVEMSGGRIWFESVEGHGSTFSFSLPRRDTRESLTARGG